MQLSERSLLLGIVNTNIRKNCNGLSLIFCTICIVDVFGVFPVVTLPKAIIDCGLYGILVIIIVCALQIYTAVLLGRCWIIAEEIEPRIHIKNRYPYSALTELTYGKTLANFVTVLVNITVFGGGIPNLIVASENLQLLGRRLTNDNFDFPFCYWIIVLGTILCPILWLGSPKDMKCLCSLSATIVILVFFLVNASLLFDPNLVASDLDEEGLNSYGNDRSTWQEIFVAYGIIAFQFDIHPTILTLQVDMNEKYKLTTAIIVGFAISVGMFAITCLDVVLKMGSSVKPSILESLPTSIILHIAAVLVAIQLCLTSAISNSALYQHLEDCLNISREFNYKRCILRSILTILAIVIAESVPRFDLVMSLIGGTLTGPLIFIFPPLIYMKMLKLRKIHEEHLALESFTNVIYEEEHKTKIYGCESIEDLEFNDFLDHHQDDPFKCWKMSHYVLCSSIIVFSVICTAATTYFNAKYLAYPVHKGSVEEGFTKIPNAKTPVPRTRYVAAGNHRTIVTAGRDIRLSLRDIFASDRRLCFALQQAFRAGFHTVLYLWYDYHQKVHTN